MLNVSKNDLLVEVPFEEVTRRRSSVSPNAFLGLYSFLHPPVQFNITLPLGAAEYKSVQWRGQKALESEKHKFRQEILVRHRALVRMLVDAYLLTPEEARAVPKPKIEVRIQNLRSNGILKTEKGVTIEELKSLGI